MLWWGKKHNLKEVTAVLITKEAEYPKEIVLDGFGEVIIKTNSPSVYERYLQAAKAKNDIIYVQDDDCVVDYRKLFRYYDGRLTNAMAGRVGFYNKISGGRVTLVGWGAFFPKAMLGAFDMYIKKYGVDPLLLMQADRVFSWLKYPHNTVRMDVKLLETTFSSDRMHSNPKHYEDLIQMIERLKTIVS